MIFVAKAAFCQKIGHQAAPNTGFYSYAVGEIFSNSSSFPGYFHAGKTKILVKSTVSSLKTSSTQCLLIRPDFYTRNFGFFCKKELQLEKTTRIPLRFRVGSLQYNDYLEQKPNTGFFH